MSKFTFLPESFIDADILHYRLQSSSLPHSFDPDTGLYNFFSNSLDYYDFEDLLMASLLFDLNGKLTQL